MQKGVDNSDNKNLNWQLNLLPFMSKIIIFLSLFFFLASFLQLIYLENAIKENPQIDIQKTLSELKFNANPTNQDIMEAYKLKALVILEASSFKNQYHQANVLLMARLWINYIGFITGMILAIVGASFILGKLKETKSKIDGKFGDNTISFASTSPGLILAFLGTSLMIANLVIHHNIETKQQAIYIHDSIVEIRKDTVKMAPILRSNVPNASTKNK